MGEQKNSYTKSSFLSRRSNNMLWLVVIGLAALAQSASLDVEEIKVNATDEAEFESLLAANDQLFDFTLLKPLKRSLFEITMEDIKKINKTQPRSLIPEDRATTDCGCGQTPATGRIVNGAEVSPMHSRPYQAFLQSCSTQGCAMCGATLINKRYAITAMHCVEGATNLVVSLGEHKLGANVESLAPQTIRVERVVRRPDYTESDVNNDIAILKLSSEVELNNNVVPACLPTDSAKTYSGQTAYVSGWGTTSEGGSTSDTLKVTSQTVLSNSDPVCVTGSGDNPVPNTKMCAYLQGTDSCQGGSGGPLVVREDGRWTLVGVVSYGIGCARTGNAGVYARVSNYLSWINSNVADGWCGNSSPATTTTASSTTGPVCDLTCAIGSLTADVSLNGIPATCNGGWCYSKDGTDLCRMFGNPCGTATTTTTASYSSAVSCSKPCYLKSALDSIRGQVSSDVIQVNAGGIPAVCDLRTNYCCATDYPLSSLCYRLGLQG